MGGRGAHHFNRGESSLVLGRTSQLAHGDASEKRSRRAMLRKEKKTR